MFLSVLYCGSNLKRPNWKTINLGQNWTFCGDKNEKGFVVRCSFEDLRGGGGIINDFCPLIQKMAVVHLGSGLP